MLPLAAWLSRRASRERPLAAITHNGGCVEGLPERGYEPLALEVVVEDVLGYR